jgi:hypothetical protein
MFGCNDEFTQVARTSSIFASLQLKSTPLKMNKLQRLFSSRAILLVCILFCLWYFYLPQNGSGPVYNHVLTPEEARGKDLPRPSKHRLSMCTMFRNEAHYLLEWIAHHVSFGFDHFYLYNHLSEDNYQEVLQPLIDKGYVTLQNVPIVAEYRQQRAAFDDCLLHRNETDWIANFDLDEYLYVSPKLERTSILTLLEELRAEMDVDLVYLNRHHFNTDGNQEPIWKKYDALGESVLNEQHEQSEEERKKVCPLVTCNYLERNTNEIMKGQFAGKLFADLRSVQEFSVHNATGYKKAVNGRGDVVVAGTLPRVLSPLSIHHYLTMSLEECMAKKVSTAFGGGWRNKSGDQWCFKQHRGSVIYWQDKSVKDDDMLAWSERVMLHMCFLDPHRAMKQGVPCDLLTPLTQSQIGKELGDASIPIVRHLRDYVSDYEYV